jgi:hypothetical protein
MAGKDDNKTTQAGAGDSKMAKARKARKPPSAERLMLEKAVKDAKSDQEKLVARSQLKTLRFKELAPKRVRRALKALDGVIALANRGNYLSEPSQREKVLKAISDRYNKFKQHFDDTATKEAEEFSL